MTEQRIGVVDDGGEHVELVEYRDERFTFDLWHVAGCSGYYAPVTLDATVPRSHVVWAWQTPAREPRNEDLGVRMPNHRARRQASFQRGTEALWDEQCHAYSVRMALIERIGPFSKASRQMADRPIDTDALWAPLRRDCHRFAYPDAYSGPTFEPRDHAASDQLVPTGRADRNSLEYLADQLLKGDGSPANRPDVMVRGHLQVKPDPFTRYTPFLVKVQPSPVRHDHAESATAFTASTDGVIGKVTLLPTTFVGKGYRHIGCVGDGWMGHREVTENRPPSARRKARVARKGSVGKRGKGVSWWSMSERSLPRWWGKATDDQRASADVIEQVLRTSSHDALVELTVDHRVIVDTANACVKRDHPDSRSFPIREYARRAALSGLTID